MMKNQHNNPTPVYDFIRTNLPLILIFLVALFLRIDSLGKESMWLDEVYTVEMSRLGPIQIVKEIIRQNENHPPLYYVLMHYWVMVFGDREFASRLLPALSGSFSVLLIYKFGKELFNKNTGLLAALIMSVSVFQIEYSQEARTYSLIVFLTLLSNYFFLRLLSVPKLKYVLGYILTGAVLIYDHYYWVFYIAAQNIYVFTKLILDRRREWPTFKRWIVLQLVLAVVSLPELMMLRGADAVHEGYWLARPNLYTIRGTVLQFSGSIPLLILFFVLSVYAVISAFGANFKVGLKEPVSRASGISEVSPFSNKIDRLYFLIILLFTPVILPFIVSLTFSPVYNVRYTIGASSILFILVAAGIDNLKFKKLKVFAVVLIVCLSLLQVYRYYEFVDKHQWREAVHYIEEKASPGDLVMVYPDFELRSLEYYLKRKDLRTMALPEKPNLDFGLKGGKIWVVSSYQGDQYNAVNEGILKQHNELLSEKDYKKIKIYLLTGKSE